MYTQETETAPIKGTTKGQNKERAIYNGTMTKYAGRKCTVHYRLNGSARITIDQTNFTCYVLETRLKELSEA